MTLGIKNTLDFLNPFCLENSMKDATYSKSATPSYIKLILTNKKSLPMRSGIFEKCLPDVYKVTTSKTQKNIRKNNPKTVV